MVQMSENEFGDLVEAGIEAIAQKYKSRLENVAFLVEDEPTPHQRRELGLACDQTLFGLYEGTPLPARMGTTKLLPDKITIFKNPILSFSKDVHEAREQVRHTIWHEVAHYFGLDHDRIHQLDGTTKPKS